MTGSNASSSAKAGWKREMMRLWVVEHRPDIVQMIESEADKKFGVRMKKKPTTMPDWLKAAK